MPLYSQDCKHAGALKSTHESEGTDNMTLFYWPYKFCQRRCTWRTPQKYHHKHTLIQPYADTCVRVHTHPDVRVCLCNMSTCNKAAHAHVKMQFLAAAVVFTVTTRCHTELHAPWFKVRSAALYGPCPTPAHSPTDPPLASNHPCSGMSHPCSVPKETLSATDQPHTDTVQCR